MARSGHLVRGSWSIQVGDEQWMKELKELLPVPVPIPRTACTAKAHTKGTAYHTSDRAGSQSTC